MLACAPPARAAARRAFGAMAREGGQEESARLTASDRAHEAIEKAKAGDPRALARLISLVENAAPELRAVARALAPLSGQARVIGLTGAPGVGKSTVTAALVAAYRKRGLPA
jgi:Mrp family chromosome partitioning ATPase